MHSVGLPEVFSEEEFLGINHNRTAHTRKKATSDALCFFLKQFDSKITRY